MDSSPVSGLMTLAISKNYNEFFLCLGSDDPRHVGEGLYQHHFIVTGEVFVTGEDLQVMDPGCCMDHTVNGTHT